MQRLRVETEPTGLARLIDDAGGVWAVVPAAPIEGAQAGDLARSLPDSRRVVLRSFRPVDDAASSFGSWSNAAWDAMEERLPLAMSAINAALPDADVLLWPGAGSVLSDAVSTLSFARKHPALGLVIDPAAWITESMRRDAEDHLDRFARALSLCESLACVVVRGVTGPGPSPGMDAATVESLLAPAIGRAGVVAAC